MSWNAGRPAIGMFYKDMTTPNSVNSEASSFKGADNFLAL